MPDSAFLDARELHQLTGYARPKEQATWLRAEGIPFKENRLGLVVCQVHAQAWVEGKPIVVSSCEPVFDRPF